MVFGSGLSMYLLTSVVPLYLAANGSGGIGAGLSTGAMMLSAVGVELLVPADAGPLGLPRSSSASDWSCSVRLR